MEPRTVVVEIPAAGCDLEVLEESSLSVATDGLIAVCDRGDLLLFVFAGRVLSGSEHPDGVEVSELRWFTSAELAEVDVFHLVPILLSRAHAVNGRSGLALRDIEWPDGALHPAYVVP